MTTTTTQVPSAPSKSTLHRWAQQDLLVPGAPLPTLSPAFWQAWPCPVAHDHALVEHFERLEPMGTRAAATIAVEVAHASAGLLDERVRSACLASRRVLKGRTPPLIEWGDRSPSHPTFALLRAAESLLEKATPDMWPMRAAHIVQDSFVSWCALSAPRTPQAAYRTPVPKGGPHVETRITPDGALELIAAPGTAAGGRGRERLDRLVEGSGLHVVDRPAYTFALNAGTALVSDMMAVTQNGKRVGLGNLWSAYICAIFESIDTGTPAVLSPLTLYGNPVGVTTQRFMREWWAHVGAALALDPGRP